MILDKLFHFLVFTKTELNICEIMQNVHTQVLVFLWEGAMQHENPIPYSNDMSKRDELEPFTVCLLS
jgi:hypothetical protein